MFKGIREVAQRVEDHEREQAEAIAAQRKEKEDAFETAWEEYEREMVGIQEKWTNQTNLERARAYLHNVIRPTDKRYARKHFNDYKSMPSITVLPVTDKTLLAHAATYALLAIAERYVEGE